MKYKHVTYKSNIQITDNHSVGRLFKIDNPTDRNECNPFIVVSCFGFHFTVNLLTLNHLIMSVLPQVSTESSISEKNEQLKAQDEKDDDDYDLGLFFISEDYVVKTFDFPSNISVDLLCSPMSSVS